MPSVLGKILISAAELVLELFEIEWLSDTPPQIEESAGAQQLQREKK